MKKYTEVDRAIYDACLKDKDFFILKTDKFNRRDGNFDVLDMSEEYARYFTSYPDVFKSFHFHSSSLGNLMIVYFDLESNYVKEVCKERERQEAEREAKRKEKLMELERDREEYLKMRLNDLAESELVDLVQRYEESTAIFKYRKAHGLSFKKMRRQASDYLNEIFRLGTGDQ